MRAAPTRTVVLMVLTLLAFAWFYVQTHRAPAPAPPDVTPVRLVPADAGGAR